MNKRYDQFESLEPDASRILLHADPSTGELKKWTWPTGRNYQLTSGIITQTGSMVFSLTTFIDEIGIDSYEYWDVGALQIYFTNAINASKFQKFFGTADIGGTTGIVNTQWVDTQTLYVQGYNLTPSEANYVMNNTPFEFRLWP